MDCMYVLLEIFKTFLKYIISKLLDKMTEILYSAITAVDEVGEESIAEAGAVCSGDLYLRGWGGLVARRKKKVQEGKLQSSCEKFTIYFDKFTIVISTYLRIEIIFLVPIMCYALF